MATPAGCGGCVELEDGVALGVVEALVAGAEALCEPATCCDCNGAEAGFREMRVCVLYVPLISVLPMHYQAAVVAVQKQPMDRKHPKTLSRMQEHMAQQHADRAYEAPVQSTAAGAF